MVDDKMAERLDLAERMLIAYGESEPKGEEVATVMSDMLCDLCHLVDYYGLSWSELLNRAHTHYLAEVEETDEDVGGISHVFGRTGAVVAVTGDKGV